MKKQNHFFVDAHSDLLLDVYRKRNFGRKSVIEEDWVPAMKRAGINLRLAAVYVDSALQPEMALKRALQKVYAFHAEMDESPSICICQNYEDIVKLTKNDKIGFMLTLEGAEPLVNDINLLDIFYKLGLRGLGLTHSQRNLAADGTPYYPGKANRLGGLSEFGIELVKRASHLGMFMDVSHLNDPGFWDVMEWFNGPVIASHSNCRSLCDHTRNLTDDQIKAIADKGGVIGLLHLCFDPKKKTRTVAHLLAHLDHIVNLVGVEHVGLGFDFYDYLIEALSKDELKQWPEQLWNTLPTDDLTKDEEIPGVEKGLIARGYKSADIELILGKNFLRVFKELLK